MRYTDPSGHLLCSELPWEENCDENSPAQIKSVARRGGLTDWGEWMLDLFLAYRETPGWWNQDGDLTLDEFLGLTLYYEYADTPTDAAAFFTEAVSRKMWWWCQENACRNDYAAVLNYVGTRQVMRSRYNWWQSGDSLTRKTPYHSAYDFPQALSMANNAIHPTNPDWKSGAVGYDVPWDWGNLSMFPRDAWASMADSERSLAVNAVVYFRGQLDDRGSPFVIVTFRQERYWKRYP